MMHWGFNWHEPSTKRGVVFVATFVIGLGMIATGHESAIDKLLLLATGVVGGLGAAVKDKP